ncbi:MAG: efflux RND transporter periplasmic adaptor subunit [Patescibacteria group bacterium]
MKKRTKIILSVLGVLIIGGIAYGATHQGSGVVVTTETVKRGDIHQTVEVTGDTQSVKDLDLAFSTSGIIAVMNVAIGDTVNAGDTLAVLSEAKIAASLAQAAGAVEQAQAALDLKTAGSADEELAVYQATVTAAEASLANATIESEQTKTTGDTNVASATDDLAHISSSTAATLSYAQQDELEALRSLVAEVRSALSSADAVLGVENNLVNVDFDQDLGIADPQSFPDAIDAFVVAAKSRDAAEDALTIASLEDATTLSVASAAAQTAYTNTYFTLIATSRTLDATTGGSSTLSLDALDAMKVSIAGATSALTADGSALTNAEQTLETATRSATNDVTDAQNALAKAQASRDQNNASAASSLSQHVSDLAKAKAQLAQIAATPRTVDLAGLRAAVAIAQAQYSTALAGAADAQINAPIDGIVTAVNADVGEQASAGTPMITLLGTSDQFEIVMDIPEADIAKVHVGQPSIITFDAFGDDHAFSGSVLSVNPAEKLIEGVVFYEAKVILDNGADVSGVKSGMSANVTIDTHDVLGALFIPKRAILEDANGKYVRIPKDDTGAFDRRSVTVGLYGDDGSAEILSGLSEGETIIVTIR